MATVSVVGAGGAAIQRSGMENVANFISELLPTKHHHSEEAAPCWHLQIGVRSFEEVWVV